MDTAIQLYSNSEFSVRTITDPDGTVWFVAKDVADSRILGVFNDLLR